MGYAHIENLYNNTTILMFRECYALEKIHGTSAHISWKEGKVSFFAGGSSYEHFLTIFNGEDLIKRFTDMGHNAVTVFGEAYGGKMQKMKATYGDNIRFIVFDVKIGDSWLNVPDAEDVAKKLGLEFVHYTKVATDLPVLNAERDADSVQAIRNGCGAGHVREGVVLRPLMEMFDKTGERIISKHKRDEFRETATPREVDPEKKLLFDSAESVALEWVTDTRLQHVLDKVRAAGITLNIQSTPQVINAMLEDVIRESKGEVQDTKENKKAISSLTAKMFKKIIKNAILVS